VKRRSREGRFAERTVVGTDDAGDDEHVVFWIERRPGAVWVVGRSVNSHLRPTDDPRPEDIVFEGYELEEALVHANEALEDDLTVLERDGRETDLKPFTRKEVIPVLERWFFGR
jgi:hypothetical protein